MVTATNSCKYCNQIATGQITQLIVAIFATRIFAVCYLIFSTDDTIRYVFNTYIQDLYDSLWV